MIEQLRVAPWVRVLDFLCVLLALLAAIIALSGGFRVHMGGIRVGVTTPWPLLLWSLAIGVVRHLAMPREPLYREFPLRVSAWARLAGPWWAVLAVRLAGAWVDVDGARELTGSPAVDLGMGVTF